MATDAISRIAADVQKAGLPVRGAATQQIRKISGTNSWSQHSYSNAIDYFPANSDEAKRAQRGERVPSLENLYQFLVDHPLARVVCYYRRGGCTTPHLDHVHVDARPKWCGDPNVGPHPCDGSPVTSERNLDPNEGSVRESITGAFDFLDVLGDANTWRRVGLIVGGVVAVVVGFVFILSETKAGQTAANLIPVGRVAGAVKTAANAS